MKTLATAAVLSAAILFAGSATSHAQYQANDLILGFDRVDNGGVGPQPADYLINLGNYQTAVGAGGTSAVDLTSLFSASTFNGLYTSLASGVSMSVVGGNGATSGRDIFTSVPRSGAGDPSVPGSTAPGPLASTFMASGANDVAAMAGPAGLNLNAGQNTTVAQSDPNSFNTWTLSVNPPSYYSGTGLDPRAATTGSAIYEDVYRAANNVNGNNFSYLGYVTLDLSSTPSLTFTPSTVPEPTTFTLMAAGALLWLWLFRRGLRPSSS